MPLSVPFKNFQSAIDKFFIKAPQTILQLKKIPMKLKKLSLEAYQNFKLTFLIRISKCQTVLCITTVIFLYIAMVNRKCKNIFSSQESLQKKLP